MKVVTLRKSALTDIPSKMRELAERLESGEVSADRVLCVVDVDNESPKIYAWGQIGLRHEAVGILFTAAHYMVD